MFWALFEGIVAPRLGIDREQSGLRAQLGLIADHTLYGAVVSASPWPYAD